MAETEPRRLLIVGMARSGLAAASLALSLGDVPVLSDRRSDIAPEDIARLVRMGAEARLGEPSEALLDGIDEVIVSPAVPPGAPVFAKAAALGIPVIAELEYAFRNLRGTVVAITGTNGKTTTSSLVGEILKNAGRVAFVAGNIGLPLSQVAPETTADTVAVVEVSSFQLEHIDAFHPHIAAILNLTPDHLDRHGNMEDYGALKEGMLKNQTSRDVLIYNAGDAFCRDVASRAAARTIAFSRETPLRSKHGAWMRSGQLVLDGRALAAADEINLPGPHNLENALAAAAIASQLNIPPAVIRHTLRTFAGVEHRMETVRMIGGVRYINDSKGTNPESSMRGVMTMTTPTVLIAGGDAKGADFTAFAETVAANPSIRHAVLIGDAAAQLEAALTSVGFTAITMAGYDFEAAVAQASRLAEAGGAVLLSPACASFDMFSEFEARGRRFKALVAQLDVANITRATAD